MRKYVTAFYLETLLLLAVFTAILLLLLGVFSSATAQSTRAGRLTKAVLLAENAAEAVAASDSSETLQRLLDEGGNAERAGDVVTVLQDGYQVDITWNPDGAMVYSTITVSRDEEEIYTLDTAVYIQEAGR